MEEIVLLKLVTGEEVVSRMLGDDEKTGWMKLSKPRVLAVQPTPDGQMGIMMIPLMVGIPEDEVLLDASKVVAMNKNDLPKQLEDGYLEQTSSMQTYHTDT